ncbi:hypothetical protein LCGC14_3148130, partial [marine sediment metagenome]
MNKKIIIFPLVFIVLTMVVYAGFLSTTVRFNPSGWEDNGSVIRTLTNNTVQVTGDADFLGNITVGGGFDNGGIDLTTLGDIRLFGDILIRGDILTITDQEINGSFLPTEDDKFNIGSAALRWKDGFFSNIVTALTFIGELKDGFRNENFTERYDLRTDRWQLSNFTEGLLKAGTINATQYEDSSLVGWWQFNNNAND